MATPTTVAARPCLRAALRAGYRGGGLATGRDIGSLIVWNVGPQACLLKGSARFTALWADGTRDIAAGTAQPLPVSASLAGQTTPPPPGADLTQGSYLQAILAGWERDDPHQPNGLCRQHDELTPATLRLALGTVVLDVPNRDLHPMQAPSVWGCHGEIDLLQIEPPGGV